MAMTSKAALVSPNAQFCRGGGMHSGVWKRKRVTSCWNGTKVELKTDEPAPGTCSCTLIRVGDEFFVARDFGNPKQKMKEYEDIWAQAAVSAAIQAAPATEGQ
jgi:hypothetical protein